MTFLHLPDEILQYIFELLGPDDLRSHTALLVTCKTVQHIYVSAGNTLSAWVLPPLRLVVIRRPAVQKPGVWGRLQFHQHQWECITSPLPIQYSDGQQFAVDTHGVPWMFTSSRLVRLDTDTVHSVRHYFHNPFSVTFGIHGTTAYLLAYSTVVCLDLYGDEKKWSEHSAVLSFLGQPAERAAMVLCKQGDRTVITVGGGMSGDRTPLGKWSMASFVHPRSYQSRTLPESPGIVWPACCLHRNVLYVFGGWRRSPLCRAMCLDLNVDSSQWRALPDLPQKRVAATLFYYKGLLWLIGGQDTHERPTATVQMFDLHKRKWRYGESLPFPYDVCLPY
eukprot:TRINITY_DN11988_c0_g1_i1.p1 TRINITY_DN11988_c0_g1~~TRINITY_DN11988_c0_g1_i1.p1  ORF type:complete len:335 (+),score=36.84 TRINITY_DN11988_c0_g1_i1:149-1153(+)